MKRVTIFTVLAIVLLSGELKASEPTSKKNAIKWNLGELAVLKTITLGYERALSSGISLNVNLCFANYSEGFGSTTGRGAYINGSITIYGINPELRFYMKNNAPKGFYVAPYLTYKGLTVTANGTNANGDHASGTINLTAFGGGGLIGYQFLFGDVFVLDLNAGFGYYSLSSGNLNITYPDNTQQSYDLGIKFKRILPVMGISIGAAF